MLVFKQGKLGVLKEQNFFISGRDGKEIQWDIRRRKTRQGEVYWRIQDSFFASV